MRYALIIAGGSGTRLWPMSRAALPKQVIPFIHGRSLIQIASDRLEGLVPASQQYICAGLKHREPIMAALKSFDGDRYLGEPMGRDTVNAVGFGAAVIGAQDPEAVIAVFTADHIIEPIDQFQKIIEYGYMLAESQPNTLVTFGVKPTHAATGFGYLQLGPQIKADETLSNDRQKAYIVDQFREKPDRSTAEKYYAAGEHQFLWNSGMFVWRANTLLDCISRYESPTYELLMQIAGAWPTPNRNAVVQQVYPKLKKISVDYAVMEPASRDEAVQVAAVPMPLNWLDVGSWPAYGATCDKDEHGNAIAAAKHLVIDSTNTLLASSDDNHLIAVIGCEDLIVVHTPDATLVSRADRAEDIKKLHDWIEDQFGSQWL